MKNYFLILFFILVSVKSFTQQTKPQINYVKNASFEELNRVPCFWTRSPKDFYRYMVYWRVPTNTTPDIITTLSNPRCWCNPASRKQSLGKQLARTGNNMMGVKTYGNGDNGAVSCWHEYIEGKLTKPLIKGKEYYVEFWVRHLSISSLYSNNIGVLFTDTLIKTNDKVAIYTTPQINKGRIIKSEDQWEKISGIIRAKKTYKYITIGNFYHDKQTHIIKSKTGTRRGAYYYIDDVLVRPLQKGDKPTTLHPVKMILPAEKEIKEVKKDTVKNIDISKTNELKVGETYKLKNINFETGKAKLIDKSLAELDKLAEYLINNKSVKIQINGYTDNVGTEKFNLKLSDERAKAVKEYLVSKGISTERISYKGYGSSKPIATNYTPEGRELNRRVEFKILK